MKTNVATFAFSWRPKRTFVRLVNHHAMLADHAATPRSVAMEAQGKHTEAFMSVQCKHLPVYSKNEEDT